MPLPRFTPPPNGNMPPLYIIRLSQKILSQALFLTLCHWPWYMRENSDSRPSVTLFREQGSVYCSACESVYRDMIQYLFMLFYNLAFFEWHPISWRCPLNVRIARIFCAEKSYHSIIFIPNMIFCNPSGSFWSAMYPVNWLIIKATLWAKALLQM